MIAQVTYQGARVDPFDTDDSMALHVFMERLVRAPVAGLERILFNDKPFHERLPGFDILRIHADVTYLWIRHRNELTLVRRVRENFLVAGHTGIENHFAHRLAFGSKGKPLVIPAIGEREDGGFPCYQAFHSTVSVGLMIE